MKLLPFVPLALLVVACSGHPEDTPPSPDGSTPDGPVADLPAHGTEGMGGAAAPAAGLQGKVVETMDAATYTYALIDTGKEEVWVAAPQVAIAVGDDVQVSGSMVMNDFHSSALDRTWDAIVFAEAIRPAGQAVAGGMHGVHGMSGDTGTPPPAGDAAIDFTDLERATGGPTVEEVFLMRDELVGNEVVIRAKVVKYSGGILGKNWLHIQDGTGTAGTNDLTITTAATCAVGDTVLVRGVLAADVDFGAGYKYDLIVEDAEVTVE